jgi:hypothetical protein
LAFIDSVSDGENSAAQVFVLPMTGGDAAKITKSATDVEQFEWKPEVGRRPALDRLAGKVREAMIRLS